MYINVIARRARKDDETLIMMVNRWTLSGSRIDPIPDILLMSKEIAYFFISLIAIIAVLPLVMWRLFHGPFTTGAHMVAWFLTLEAVLMLFIGWKIGKIKGSITNLKNAVDFCMAFELIEHINRKRNKTEILWIDYPIGSVRFAVEVYLQEQASVLASLRLVPLRKLHAEELSKKFNWEKDVLTCLMHESPSPQPSSEQRASN